MIKAIVVDDELSGRENLKYLLKPYSTEIDIVCTAASVDEAYDCILKYKPDVVFLDVEMPPTDGFSLLNMFKEVTFETIFVTAHDRYALKALRVAAIDYLLKPINPQELKVAITKLKNKLLSKVTPEKEPAKKKLVLATREMVFSVDIANIVYIASDGSHKCVFTFRTGEEVIVTKDLSDYEDQLAASGFFRCHRSYIINLASIREYIPTRSGGHVIMQNGKVLPLANQKKNAFYEIMNMS
jgi:two-component system LytT family response regulator